MKKLFNIFKNNNGISLVEILVAVGMLGAVALVSNNFLGQMNKSKVKIESNQEISEYQRQVKKAFYTKDICNSVIPKNINNAVIPLNELSYINSRGNERTILKIGKLNAKSKIDVSVIRFTMDDFTSIASYSAGEIYTGLVTLTVTYNKCMGSSTSCTQKASYDKDISFPISGKVTSSGSLEEVECNVQFTDFIDQSVEVSSEGFGLIQYVNPFNQTFEGIYGLPVYEHEQCRDKQGKALFECEKANKVLIGEANGGVDTLSKAFCDLNKDTMFDIAAKSELPGVTLTTEERFNMYTQLCPVVESANCIWMGNTLKPGDIGKGPIEHERKKVFSIKDNLISRFKKYDDRFKNSSNAQLQTVRIDKDRGLIGNAITTSYNNSVANSSNNTQVLAYGVGHALIAGIATGLVGMLHIIDVCPKYDLRGNYKCTDGQMQFISGELRDSKWSWIPSKSKCGAREICIKLFGKKRCVSLPRGPCCYMGPWQS